MSIRANLHVWTGHRPAERCHRYFAVYRIGGNDRRRIETHLEMVTRRKPHGCGFRLHFGNAGSETPIDAHLDLGWCAIFWSFYAPGLGRFLERMCRGHKRDLSLKIHNGHLWWRLWFDDDMGYDSHHRCDSWRKPKLWPWSAGRRKHRAWMCLRDGNIKLNPLSAFWGDRLYSYEDIEKRAAKVPIWQFAGDEYEVDFTLQKQTRSRRFGPRWARGWSDEGWTAHWDARNGIPYRNHDWKGDNVLSSAERIPFDPADADWIAYAVQSLAARIRRDRERYNYVPPKAV